MKIYVGRGIVWDKAKNAPLVTFGARGMAEVDDKATQKILDGLGYKSETVKEETVDTEGPEKMYKSSRI